MFDKMRALLDMQKKMQELKRELDSTDFEAQSADGLVMITMNGSQEVKGVSIQRDLKDMDKTSLERAVKDAFNAAVKRAQDIAAGKMKNITGLNFPAV